MKLIDFTIGQVFRNKNGVVLEILTVESGGTLKIKTTENGDESVGLWDWRRFSWIIERYGFQEVQ